MEQTCEWTYRELNEYWQTDCGESFVLFDGGPGDNHMRYCPYCGRPLVEVRPDRDPDEAGPGMRAKVVQSGEWLCHVCGMETCVCGVSQ